MKKSPAMVAKGMKVFEEESFSPSLSLGSLRANRSGLLKWSGLRADREFIDFCSTSRSFAPTGAKSGLRQTQLDHLDELFNFPFGP